MKYPTHGPTEILRYPDGHCAIVTKVWWHSFLNYLVDIPSVSPSILSAEGTSTWRGPSSVKATTRTTTSLKRKLTHSSSASLL